MPRARALMVMLLAAACAACASAFVLHPSTSPSGVHEGRRFLEVPGVGRLEVFVAGHHGEEAQPRFAMLEFVGNAGRADYGSSLPSNVVDAFALESWRVNYPGFGQSEGAARLRHIAPAARVAFDELRREHPRLPIVVYGYSLGSTAALHLAANRPVTAVILQNAPPVGRMILRRYGWWNLWLAALPVAAQIPRALWCRPNARRATAPAAFLISERDEVVSPSLQRSVFRAYGGEKRAFLMTGARHNDQLPAEVQRALVAWLQGVLEATRATRGQPDLRLRRGPDR